MHTLYYKHPMRNRIVTILFSCAFLFSLLAMATPAVSGQQIAYAASSTSTDTPDILIPSVQGQSVTQRLANRARSSWPWYITRAAGLLAAFTLVLLILSGVGLITGYTFRFFEPLTAWAVHRAIGITFGVSVLVHIGALLFDKFVPFSILQALVPFLSPYRPLTIAGYHLGSLYVALGILAFYGLALIIITSLFIMDRRPRLWKAVHILSYLVVAMVFVHALFIGTDLAHGSFRAAWLIFGGLLLVAILMRLRRVGSA